MVAIVVAGGIGKRMGKPIPKQFLKINGKEILKITVERISQLRPSLIIVTAPRGFIEKTKELLKGFSVKVVEGGTTRQESVFKALKNTPSEEKIVLIHDGVRPFFPIDKTLECLEKAREIGAATLALPVKETIAVVQNGKIESIPERSILWTVQTPQCFKKSLILKAHEFASSEGFSNAPDDTFLILKYSLSQVGIVEGSEYNIKITHELDLEVARILSPKLGREF